MPLLNEGKSPKELERMQQWYKVRAFVRSQFGKRPDINAILFLIGINELGFVKEEFGKEEKQDLMHVAICTLFESDGYFTFTERDKEGWPHFEATDNLPKEHLRQQEGLLKEKIIDYFLEQELIE